MSLSVNILSLDTVSALLSQFVMFQNLVLAQSSGIKKEYMFFKASKILVLSYFLNTSEGVNALTICEVQFSAVRLQW